MFPYYLVLVLCPSGLEGVPATTPADNVRAQAPALQTPPPTEQPDVKIWVELVPPSLVIELNKPAVDILVANGEAATTLLASHPEAIPVVILAMKVVKGIASDRGIRIRRLWIVPVPIVTPR